MSGLVEDDAELTPYGEMLIGDLGNEVCEFCNCGMISRFGGIVGTNECSSCSADFRRLNDAGKLEVA